MNSDIVVLPAGARIRDVGALVAGRRDEKSQHLYPVSDDEGNLVGAITYADLRHHVADAVHQDAVLGDLVDPSPHAIFSNQTLRTAIHLMAETGVTRLLVLNPNDHRKLVGKLALHDVLKARVRHVDEERRRERVLPWEF